MPDSVRKALKKVFETEGRLSAAEATRFLEKLETERKFQEETWS